MVYTIYTMVSFVEIALLFLCIGIILFLLSLTSYSFRVKVSGEKKESPARYGIDYVIVTFHNYFSPSTIIHPNTDSKYTKYDMHELRHRKEGGAYSPHLPFHEKEKIV